MKHFLFLFSLILNIAIHAQSVPYNVDRRKFPLGEDYQKLLPQKLGMWNRFSFHDFIPGIEHGHVYYQKDKKEVFVQFGKALNPTEMKVVWQKFYEDATVNKEDQIKQQNNTNPSTKYVLMNGKSGYFFAWTRNLYYFSIKTKLKEDADEFMKVFPW